jgi:hypothetical protein
LFVDGVPYSHTDGVVGFWVINTVTEKRVLVAAMRTQLACSCGCRGWCNYHAILSFLAWSFRCLGKGGYPATRHDGTEFFSCPTSPSAWPWLRRRPA